MEKDDPFLKTTYTIDIGSNFDSTGIITITPDDTFTLPSWINDTLTIDTTTLDTAWIEEYTLAQEWREINKVAKNNETLQKAIERVKILYYLSKEDDNSKT